MLAKLLVSTNMLQTKYVSMCRDKTKGGVVPVLVSDDLSCLCGGNERSLLSLNMTLIT